MCLPAWLHAQVGGESVFPLLDESPSARTTAMGGLFISVFDNDAALALQNPSLINPSMHNRLSLHYIDFLGRHERRICRLRSRL